MALLVFRTKHICLINAGLLLLLFLFVQLGFDHDHQENQKLCPLRSPLLVGELKVNANVTDLREVENRLLMMAVEPGGSHRPSDCQSRDKVAIIVAYRNRQSHLVAFLNHMHPFLQRQQLDYTIYVVEQSERSAFNRGMLMNIGVKEALERDKYDCVILHDVDMLPENDHNLYTCPEEGKPRQLCIAISTHGYKPARYNYLGGVTAFASADYIRINGYSNLFWGWGVEDTDLHYRAIYHNLAIVRYPVRIGRYTMQPHKDEERNPKRLEVLRNGTSLYRPQVEGLGDLEYDRLAFELRPLYTHILVEIEPREEYDDYE